VPNVALRFTPTPSGNGQSADNRSFIRKLMPGPPPMRSGKPAGSEEPGAGSRVWVLRANKPAAVPVTTGITNGKQTEILSGSLGVGEALVVEEMKAEK
jgi:HlyD family secretion protein